MEQVTGERSALELHLESLLTCPVCLAVPASLPILACVNGHLLCVKCRGALSASRCPVCQNPNGWTRLLLAEQIIDSLLPRPCRYDKRGSRLLLREFVRNYRAAASAWVFLLYVAKLFNFLEKRVSRLWSIIWWRSNRLWKEIIFEMLSEKRETTLLEGWDLVIQGEILKEAFFWKRGG